MSKLITIATCQYAVTGNLDSNLRMILKLMQKSKDFNPDIVHFSECNLSGYAGIVISKIDPNQKFVDPSYYGRMKLNQTFNSHVD